MAQPTKIYVSLSNPIQTVELDGVFFWAWLYEREPRTFRDLSNQALSPTAAAGDTGGTGSAVAVSGVPVSGVADGTIVSDATSITVKPIVFDDWSHTPPREYWEAQPRKLVVSLDEAYQIPLQWTQSGWARTFTASVATNVFTCTTHDRTTGDIVTAFSTGTLVSGLTAASKYTFIKVDDDSFMLLDADGNLVDVTNAQAASTHTLVLVTSVELPSNLNNLIVFPADRSPLISTAAPSGFGV